VETASVKGGKLSVCLPSSAHVRPVNAFERLAASRDLKGGGAPRINITADRERAVMMQRRTQPYCSPSRRRAFLAIALFGGILPGCVTSTTGGDVQRGDVQRGEVQRGDVLSAIREVDLTPRFPRQVRSSQAGGEKDRLQGASYYAEGVAAVPGDLKSSKRGSDDALTTGALPDRAQDSGGKGYEMNFENAPVASVAKAVLGDILGVGYTIDARVQGTVNLSSGRPVPRKDLLYALESALRTSRGFDTSFPPTLRMTSPVLTPRSAAGPSGSSDVTMTPWSPAPSTSLAGASCRPRYGTPAVCSDEG